MRARLFWPIVIGFALTACAFQRAQIANDARINMIGLSKEQVLACMGPPLNHGCRGGRLSKRCWRWQREQVSTRGSASAGAKPICEQAEQRTATKAIC
jgi:hypothetical protein